MRKNMLDWKSIFDKASDYDMFLRRYGNGEQQRRWNTIYESVFLAPEQQTMVGAWSRIMNVLCLAGAWCGDCAREGPILRRIAQANPRITLRFLDRDADPKAAAELRLCGGGRVPVVVFLSEDFAECGRYGDRTLSTYRRMAGELSGAACPTGLGALDEPWQDVVTDWLREFERIQLMLRLSPRLRERYGD